jgi:hypothetical protein
MTQTNLHTKELRYQCGGSSNFLETNNYSATIDHRCNLELLKNVSFLSGEWINRNLDKYTCLATASDEML